MNKRAASVGILALVAALCAAMLLFAAGCSCSSTAASSSESSSMTAIDTFEPSTEPATPTEEETAEMPIDFAALQEQNQDVYAWLYMPDTAVNLPVLQNSFADNYYLVHDAYGNANDLGALYTQSVNSLDFLDPVTVIYGHTFEVGGQVTDQMMGTLHYYEDEQFFNDHPTFYIYTPEKVLTYELVSAYEYDSRHIMNAFDFSDPEVVQSYFDSVLNPDSMVKNVRAHERLEAGKDHIVQLSTCTHPPNDSARYLITGVLVNEQSAK